MTDPTAVADRYLAAWNEITPDARRVLVDQVFAEGARYVDPLAEAAGRGQIDATIGAVQAQFPGFVFRRSGPADGHHAQVRFRWELGPVGEEAPIVGFDVVTLDDEGRIDAVLGFLDRVPGAEGATPTAEPPAGAAPVPSYAVGLLRDVQVGTDLEQYLQRIDGTLAPFGGRYLIHGEPPDDVEGPLPGDLVVIGFPDRDGAADWYHSAGYQAIADLRRCNSTGSITLHRGVPAHHRATDVLG